jgi:polyisoprenoid-binding protein YceI
MKKIILCISAFFILSTIHSQEKLNINTQKSTIKWIGEYTFSFSGHNGNILFKEGYFIKTNEVITGGSFEIDMNSITNNDIKTKKANASLVNHLKNPDFFDVKKFPLATLKITKFEYFKNNQIRVDAKLTIKGIANPIHFNGELNYEEKELKARFKIDRQAWNVSYKSKMKDSPISDAIGFEISIKL